MKTDFSNASGTLHVLTERDESGHILLAYFRRHFVEQHKGAFFLEQIPGYLKTLVKLPIATRLNKLGHLVWTAGYLNNPTWKYLLVYIHSS